MTKQERRADSVRSLDTSELMRMCAELREKMGRFDFSKNLGKQDRQTHLRKDMRKQQARILTILGERAAASQEQV